LFPTISNGGKKIAYDTFSAGYLFNTIKAFLPPFLCNNRAYYFIELYIANHRIQFGVQIGKNGMGLFSTAEKRPETRRHLIYAKAFRTPEPKRPRTRP
jgi:hypothetical protein